MEIVSTEDNDQFNKEDVYFLKAGVSKDGLAHEGSVIVKEQGRKLGSSNNQSRFFRATIADIKEKFKHINVKNVLKRNEYRPAESNLRFISLHKERAYFLNKDKQLLVFEFNNNP